jgi:hypothetical protein
MTLAKRNNRSLSIKRKFPRKSIKPQQQQQQKMQQSNSSLTSNQLFNKQSVPYSNKMRPKNCQTRYKKSKPIKIGSSYHNNNNQNNQHYSNYNQNKPYANSVSSINFDPNNTAAAAAALAHIIRNQLTINLTKDEPRLFAKTQQVSQYQNLAAFQLPYQFAQLQLKNGGGLNTTSSSLNQGFKLNNQSRYPTSRFKYIKPNSTKNTAPYNTTQYIMYDYSKRTPHDQVCPNEQQQFSEEWNLALANSSSTMENSTFPLSFDDEEDELEHKECSLSAKERAFSKSDENLSQSNNNNNRKIEKDCEDSMLDSVFQLSTSL